MADTDTIKPPVDPAAMSNTMTATWQRLRYLRFQDGMLFSEFVKVLEQHFVGLSAAEKLFLTSQVDPRVQKHIAVFRVMYDDDWGKVVKKLIAKIDGPTAVKTLADLEYLIEEGPMDEQDADFWLASIIKLAKDLEANGVSTNPVRGLFGVKVQEHFQGTEVVTEMRRLIRAQDEETITVQWLARKLFAVVDESMATDMEREMYRAKVDAAKATAKATATMAAAPATPVVTWHKKDPVEALTEQFGQLMLAMTANRGTGKLEAQGKVSNGEAGPGRRVHYDIQDDAGHAHEQEGVGDSWRPSAHHHAIRGDMRPSPTSVFQAKVAQCAAFDDCDAGVILQVPWHMMDAAVRNASPFLVDLRPGGGRYRRVFVGRQSIMRCVGGTRTDLHNVPVRAMDHAGPPVFVSRAGVILGGLDDLGVEELVYGYPPPGVGCYQAGPTVDEARHMAIKAEVCEPLHVMGEVDGPVMARMRSELTASGAHQGAGSIGRPTEGHLFPPKFPRASCVVGDQVMTRALSDEDVRNATRAADSTKCDQGVRVNAWPDEGIKIDDRLSVPEEWTTVRQVAH